MYEIIASLSIFFIVYIFIVSEKLHRTVVAMIGATTLMFLQIFESPHEVYTKYVDFNTVFLLIGMMLFVAAMKRTGFFHYVGIKGLKIAGGDLKKLFLVLTTLVAVISAFIDNVTTVMIFVPLTLAVADAVNFDPIPFVLGEVFASNIGGTATLIGDPPNILIGMNAKLSFMDFLFNLAPISILIFIVVNVVLMLIYRKELSVSIRESMRDDLFLESRNPKLILGEFLLAITVFLFLVQHKLNLSASSIALMMGFLSVLLIKSDDVSNFLKEIDWETIFFFIALFIITGSLEETGILEKFAHFIVETAGDSMEKLQVILISFSAFLSSIVDNIPYTATMIPVIESLKKIDPKTFSDLTPLWWSLALGACLGGNGTPVGASANVVALQILQQSGRRVSFKRFVKTGVVVVLISVIMSSLYVLMRY